jgi:hypothetical protein
MFAKAMRYFLPVFFCAFLGFFFKGLGAQVHIFGPDQGFCQGRNIAWNSNQSAFLFFGAERADANATDGLVFYQIDTLLNTLSQKNYLLPGPAFPGSIEPLFNSNTYLACGGYYLPSGASVGALLWLNAQGDTLKTKFFPVLFGSSSIKRSSTSVNGKIGIVGYRTSSQDNSSDIWIAQLDSLGNLEWERTLGGPANDVGHGIRWHSGKQAWAISGDFETTSYGNYLAFINEQGQWLNDTLISDANANGNYVLEIDQNQRIFMVGESTTNSGPAFDVFVVSTHSNGVVQRWGYFGGTGTEAGFALLFTPDDSLVISGYSTTFNPNLPINPFVAKIDKSFSGGRYKSLNGLGIGISYGVARGPNNHLYVSGSLDQRHFVWKIPEDSLVDLDGNFGAFLGNPPPHNSTFSVAWLAHKMAWEVMSIEQSLPASSISLRDLRGHSLAIALEFSEGRIFIYPAPHLPPGIYILGIGNQWKKISKP